MWQKSCNLISHTTFWFINIVSNFVVETKKICLWWKPNLLLKQKTFTPSVIKCWSLFYIFWLRWLQRTFQQTYDRDWSHYCISGVDFTNILWPALMHEDPKSAKRHCNWWFDCLFALLGSAHKTLVKLTPDFCKVNLNGELTLLVHCLY